MTTKKEQERRRSPEYKEAQRKYKRDQYNIPEIRETLIKRVRNYAKSNPEKILVRAAKNRALRLGVPFSLKSSDISIPKICPVFGIILKTEEKGFSDFSPSLDRILPEKGYTTPNIIVVSKRANRIRGSGGAKEHERIAEWMKEFREGKVKITRTHKITEQERTMVHQARIRSKKSGVICSINPEDVVVPDRCPVFGTKFSPGTRQNHLDSPSLDRVDPSKGYTADNICVISWRANKMKADGTEDEHRIIARYIRSLSEAKAA